MKKENNLQSLFKKWIVKRPNGNCQILFALTELDGFCNDIVLFLSKKWDFNSQLKEEKQKWVGKIDKVYKKEQGIRNWLDLRDKILNQ